MTHKIIDGSVMLRLWAKDKSLFFGSPMLDWLDEPQRLEKHLAALEKVADDAKKRFSYFVLLGMGGSSAAPKMFKELLGKNTEHFLILDSIHPHEVARVENTIDIKKTLFIVASKSGSTMEPLLLYRHFLQKLETSVSDPFSHFLAITDPISPLEQESVENGFLHAPLGRPNIGGRYSGLSVFGILPALLMGIDVKPLLNSAITMAKNTSFSVIPKHMAIDIAQVLFAHNQKNLFIYLSDTLKPMGLWLEQLIAESLGKEGQGAVPIIVDKACTKLGLAFGIDGEPLPKADLSISLPSPWDVGGLMFAFQVGVALAGYLLNINPFDQPDVERSKQLTKDIIHKPKAEPQPADAPSKDSFLDQVLPGDYCAILSYLPEEPHITAELLLLKAALAPHFDNAVMLQQGPRYLHSTGQLFKGGPNTGHFLLLTGNYQQDFLSEGMSMAHIHLSQALGDIAALKELSRKVCHLDQSTTSFSFKKIMGELCK